MGPGIVFRLLLLFIMPVYLKERSLARFQGLRNASQLSTGRHQPWFGSLSISFPEYPDSCRKRTVPALTFSHPQRHETATGPCNGCGAKLPFEVKSYNRVSNNQWLASLNFPVLGNLHQSRISDLTQFHAFCYVTLTGIAPRKSRLPISTPQ